MKTELENSYLNGIYFQAPDNTQGNTSNQAETNQEPYPTFDIEINKEDKDKDVDNPDKEDEKKEKVKEDEKSNKTGKNQS